MAEAEQATAQRGAGCLVAGLLFVVVFVAVWLAAVTMLGLVAEQWRLIRASRAFSQHWVYLHAPLIALATAAAAALAVRRRWPAVRVILIALAAGLVALCAGILFFGLGVTFR